MTETRSTTLYVVVTLMLDFNLAIRISHGIFVLRRVYKSFLASFTMFLCSTHAHRKRCEFKKQHREALMCALLAPDQKKKANEECVAVRHSKSSDGLFTPSGATQSTRNHITTSKEIGCAMFRSATPFQFSSQNYSYTFVKVDWGEWLLYPYS